MNSNTCLGKWPKHYYSGWRDGTSGPWIKSRFDSCVRRGCENPNPYLAPGDPGVPAICGNYAASLTNNVRNSPSMSRYRGDNYEALGDM